MAGPPSSRTTRRPSASLPRERPRVAVSMMAGMPDDHQRAEDDRDDALRPPRTPARSSDPEDEEPADEHDDDEDDVDRAGRHPRRDARGRHLDGDALAGDEVVAGVAAVAPGVGHPAMLTRRAAGHRRLGCARWTSTPTSLVHRAQWARLEELAGRRRLTGAEADELLDLYQRVSTHLSVVRSASPDPSVVTYLSSLLARARGRLGRRPHLDVGGPRWASSPAPSRPRSTAPAGGGARRPLASVALAALVGLVVGRTTPRCGPAR